jgi:hypothetical protein
MVQLIFYLCKIQSKLILKSLSPIKNIILLLAPKLNIDTSFFACEVLGSLVWFLTQLCKHQSYHHSHSIIAHASLSLPVLHCFHCEFPHGSN